MDNAGWEQMQAEEERVRLELDCLIACYKGGNEKSAEILAASLGLSNEFKQEIQEKAYAAHR